MTLSKWRVLSVFVTVSVCAFAAAAAERPGTGPDKDKIVVYRDTWGVPHIYAPTVEGGLYAMGWAQAQDRPEEMLKNFMRAMGQSATFDGPGAVQSDLVSHLWDHYGTSKRNFLKIRPDIRRQIRAYVEGINDFYAAHPK
ncbi:MAG TPA: hypothetical protein ENI81_03935, partial [Phycisphaerales bacterium]|nr:hypothetical protein [Phycisphaerales bacterium]